MIENKGQRKIALLLSLVMIISLLFGTNIYAADGTTMGDVEVSNNIENSVVNETDTNEIESVDEEIAGQDISVTNNGTQDYDNNVADNNEENISIVSEENTGSISSGSQGLINYVSVDYPYLETPDDQNIVVSYGDGSENVTDAKLIYQSDEGDTLEMTLSKKEGELFLFTDNFDERDAGVYTLTDFVYVQDAVKWTIHLPDIGIESMFGVNEEYPGYGETSEESEELSQQEVEMSVVDVETGEVEESSEEIEDAITATANQVSTIRTSKASRAATQKSDNLVVVLDPGHGGSDGGASANGLVEKNLNLKIAQYCKAELEQYSGVTVYMTRSDDRYLDIDERVNIAADTYHADVLVSIHINSASSAANGAEVYYPNANYNPSVSEPGRNLAQQIQNQLVALGLTDRGIKVRNTVNDIYPDGSKQDYYGIIRYSKQHGFPGIIVEHAFISNPSDAAKLAQESFLQQLGIADATGIANAYGLSKNPEVNVYNKNDYEGTLQLRVTGVGSGANVAIWSEEGGQDDIHKYSFSGSSQTIDIDTADYKNTKGKYLVHVYNLDNTQMLCSSSFYISTDTSAEVTAESVDGKEIEYDITIEFADMPDSITNISVPVWHETDQSDIIWHTAKKISENAWQTTISVNDYKASGDYIAHVYATVEDGSRYLIGSAGFTVSEVSLSVRTDNYNQTAGTFDVFVENISSVSGVDRVQIPVWSASDQSNIVWYEGKKQENGSYKATVNIADHDYGTGSYKVHVYLTAGNGVTGFTATSQEVQLPEMEISAKNFDGKEMEYNLRITNAGQIRGLRNVQFATWSIEGGQDDIIWYSGRKSGVSDWEATAPIQNHKTAGEYAVHVYGTLLDGSLKLLGTTKYTVSSPQLSVRTDNYNQTAGTFDVFVENISSASGVDRVQIPVWSASDQSNIVWYDGQRQENGSYKATVNIANHDYGTESYKVHVYLTAGNGVTGFTSTSQEVKLPEMKISADNLDGKEMEYSLKITNAGQIRGLRNVQFATWSMEGGQDDIIWYSGRKSGVSDWEATASIQNHKTAGEYAVHVYGTLLDGSLKLLGTTEYTVSSPQLSVRTDNYDQTAGTFDVFVENISSASGVDRVQIPVWSASDQSNIVWYDGQRQADGSYKATVNIADHAYGTGTYKVHVYLTAGNGVTGFTSTSQEVKLPEMKISADNLDGKEMEYSLKITNAGQIRGLRNVQFATWSMEGGQDDIIWYSGRKSGVSDWEATASIQNHKTAGEYAVHVYGTLLDGSLKLLGTTKFYVSNATASEVVATDYDSTTGNFNVRISGIEPSGLIGRVQVPVWSASNQSDIVWYDAQKQGDGTWVANVDPIFHNFNSGNYTAHVYVTLLNGVQTLVGTTSQNVVSTKYYTIMGDTTVTISQMVRYFNSSGASYPAQELQRGGAGNLETFCQIYLEEAQAEGVRAEVAFAQAMKETGWLRFGGIVRIDQFNFAGIGAVDGNAQGNCASFRDVRTGVRAQIQHLKAYASTEPLNNGCEDPRFNLVSRGVAPYVEWLGIKENPQGVGWASAANYGIDIVNMIKIMKTM